MNKIRQRMMADRPRPGGDPDANAAASADASIDTWPDARFVSDDSRWQAVITRHKAAVGHFVYAVRTTAIYCRPTCPSKRPKRGNVLFFVTASEAAKAGFRACRRCHPDLAIPDGPDAASAAIVAACRKIGQSETLPDLDRLAMEAGYSRFYFQRRFKSLVGVSPRAYALACRAQRMQENLMAPGNITRALYDSGFNSPGRFYAKAREHLGMNPETWRKGGAGETIRVAIGNTSLGLVLVGATDRGVCTILIGDNRDALLADFAKRFPHATPAYGDATFAKLLTAAIGLIDDPSSAQNLPLDIRGTVFQQKVWQALRDIPAGTTLTYAQLAARINAPKAARAVAGACAANPVAIAIPCHRIIRNDGTLSGYRWGVERKRILLEREKAHCETPSSRTKSSKT